MIHREISRVLVLHPLWQIRGAPGTAKDKSVLDNAFALIEGHPLFLTFRCITTIVSFHGRKPPRGKNKTEPGPPVPLKSVKDGALQGSESLTPSGRMGV